MLDPDADTRSARSTGTDTDVRELPTATSARRQRTTDQWFQWAAYTGDGQYGDDELTGWSDFSLSGSRGLRHFGVVRVTTSSMPPPTQFAGAFFGTTPDWPPASQAVGVGGRHPSCQLIRRRRGRHDRQLCRLLVAVVLVGVMG